MFDVLIFFFDYFFQLLPGYGIFDKRLEHLIKYDGILFKLHKNGDQVVGSFN